MTQPTDEIDVIAVVKLRAPFQRRGRRSRIERIDDVAAGINAEIQRLQAQFPSTRYYARGPLVMTAPEPVAYASPPVWLAGLVNFWGIVPHSDTMLLRTDAVISFLVTHRSLALPWECNLILATGPWRHDPSLLPQFNLLELETHEHAAFNTFWTTMAGRWGLTRVGLD